MVYSEIFSQETFLLFFGFRNGILILLILILISLNRKINKQGNLYLALFFGMIWIALLNDGDLFDAIHVTTAYHNFLNRALNLPTFSIPVFFYLSISYFVKPYQKLQTYFYYFIPWLINLVLLIPFFCCPDLKSVSPFWKQYATYYPLVDVVFSCFGVYIVFIS